jgi:hypothetical protein
MVSTQQFNGYKLLANLISYQFLQHTGILPNPVKYDLDLLGLKEVAQGRVQWKLRSKILNNGCSINVSRNHVVSKWGSNRKSPFVKSCVDDSVSAD